MIGTYNLCYFPVLNCMEDTATNVVAQLEDSVCEYGISNKILVV